MATEYISREAAIEIICGPCAFKAACVAGVEPRCKYYTRMTQIPAADVVEVVRCRDCKHRPVVKDESHPYGFGLACPKEGAYQDVTCPYLCDDGYYNRMPADDWYCAEGDRRVDNG